jgi:hypothetical protein
MKRTINILLILISTLSFSQNNSESEVFKKVIDYEIRKGISGIYVQCEKPKTSFDLNDFKEQTGLEVPENILKEIENNGTKSSNGIWNSELINKLNYDSDFIKSKKCLTKKDVELIFKKTRKRQNIVSISEPVFDNNYENCVVSVTYWKFTGSAYGRKYFLNKVYGVWTVIVEYEHWMT